MFYLSAELGRFEMLVCEDGCTTVTCQCTDGNSYGSGKAVSVCYYSTYHNTTAHK